MNGPEARLVWSPIKKELVKRHWHHQRFEDTLTPGIPDLNIKIPDGPEAWIELKYADEGYRVCLGLRREQFIWLRDAKRAGRSCYLLCRVGGEWFLWADEASWEAGKRIAEWDVLRASALGFETPGEILDYFTLRRREEECVVWSPQGKSPK